MQTTETSDGTYKSETGAVRSSDGEHLDFTTMPVLGILAVAKVCGTEGNRRYGRYNYVKGFPAWKLINRSMRHIFLFFTSGNIVDLAHAAWGLLDAIQELTLRPEQLKLDFLRPGMTFSAEMLTEMEKDAPKFAAFRQTKEGKELDKWVFGEMPEIKEILEARGVRDKPVATSAELKELDDFAKSVREADRRAAQFSKSERSLTRTEDSRLKPNPEPGESWVENENGIRIYYK